MTDQKRIQAILCKQWLTDWDSYPFPEENQRKRPPEKLLVFSMSARQLRKLSGVYVRKREGTDATGIQRLHEKERSQKISEYVKAGYPFGDLSAKQKTESSNNSLKKPGWLPTAIVVNFLKQGDVRRGKSVASNDILSVVTKEQIAEIILPTGSDDANWQPADLPPVEVIDGQHRLFAFDENSQLPDDFELPVVAFHGLDIGWQAYLFWSINVSPKKINPSHAYDLFPLLRTQDWLESVSAVHVYREARAQELTDLLFRHSASPWRGRINMLGERKSGWVSQAGWVQAIYNSFLSPGLGRSRKGLFAANLSPSQGPLNWSRPQQAAFLIFIWKQLQSAVYNNKAGWATQLRDSGDSQMDLGGEHDPAFLGTKTLLNQEQGVRGICLVFNDLLFLSANNLGLDKWESDDIDVGETRAEDIDKCLNELESQDFSKEIIAVAEKLSEFDWRSSDANGLTEEEQLKKAAFRGTGGYGRVRQELLRLLAGYDFPLAKLAKQILDSEEKE